MICGALLLGGLLLGRVAHAGPTRTAFPRWTAGPVLVSGTPDVYASVRAHIRAVEAKSRQRYTVVVVGGTGRGDWATRNYTDRLHDHWSRGGGDLGRLAHERGILIVVAMENRQLAVRASALLQRSYGLRGQAIDRQFVRNTFVPAARSGRHAEGLRRLIDALERHIGARDQRATDHVAAAKQRAAKRLQDALAYIPAGLAEIERAHAVLTKRLALLKAAGVDVASPESQVRAGGLLLQQRETLLGRAQQRAPASAQDASRIRSTSRAFASLTVQLDRIEAARSRLPLATTALESRLVAVEGALAEAASAGLGIADLRARVARVDAAPEAGVAPKAAKPAEALQGVQAALAELGAIDRALTARPAQHARFMHRSESFSARLADLQARVAAAGEAGLEVTHAEDRVRAVAASQAGAMTELPTSYAAAQALLGKLSADLRDIERGVIRRVDAHHYRTAVVPRRIGAGVGGALLIVLLALRLLRRGARSLAVEQLALYTRARLASEATLTGFAGRHQALRLEDPHFRERMTGTTRITYDAAGLALHELRRRWHSAEASWAEARALIDKGHLLRRWRYLDACKSLVQNPPPKLETEILARVAVPLEALEGARAGAKADRSGLRTHADRLQSARGQIETAGLSSAAYVEATMEIADLLRDTEGRFTHDPLGVRAELALALPVIGGWVRSAEAVVLGARRFEALEATETDIAAEAVRRRDAGFRFLEEGSDPDPHLAAAHTHRERAWTALDAGDPDSASRALDRAAQASGTAAQAIQAQVEGRDLCAQQIPLLRADVLRLQGLATQTDPHMRALTASFDPASVEEVAEVMDDAEETFVDSLAHLAKAESLTDSATQAYVRGAQIVRETQAAHAAAEVGLLRVVSLRQELEGLRDLCTAALLETKAEMARIGAWLTREQRDRLPANERFARASAHYGRADAEAVRTRPHWRIANDLLVKAAGGIRQAEALAEDDVRLSSQAEAALREAASAINDADRHYPMGVNVDVSGARRAYRRAVAALSEQAYEEALIQAADAEQQAEEAASDAESAVRAAQRLARRRRQQAAAARRRRTASSSSWGGGGGFSGGSSFGGGGSGTSQSSW